MARSGVKLETVEGFAFQHGTELLRKLTENAAVGTFLSATNGQILYANRAFCDLLGYSRDEIVGVGVKEIVHPDDRAGARENLKQVSAGDHAGYRVERRYVRKDGRPIWVLVSASTICDEDGKTPLYVIVQAIDISRQKRAEAALAESESRLNFALEAARQGVWDHDVKSGTVHYSRMWRLMRGFEPDEEVDSRQEVWLARLHPDDQARIREQIKKQDHGVDGYDTLVYRERHRDGHYIWILSRGKPVEWDANGNPLRVVGTDTDITRQKMAELALEEEKERLRVTLESIGDGVISTDAEGRVTFMNPAAEKMTGWEEREAVGQRVVDVFDVVDEETGQPAPDPVTECLSREEPFRLDQEVILVSRSGERRDIRDSAAPVRMPDGSIIGAVLVFQDVTEGRAMQRQLAYSAMHDSLTGLPNRLSFERALVSAIDQAKRESREHALCFVDLDRFKQVNDSAGHSAGDALLRQIGEVIRRSCRSQDFTARIGGDEFAILLADCSTASATRIAAKIIEQIGAVQFAWAGCVYRIGASIGITAITHDAGDAHDLMNEADAACYVAKEDGRNMVAVFDGRRPGSDRFKESA